MASNNDISSELSNHPRVLSNYPMTGTYIFSIGELPKRNGGVTYEDAKPEYIPMMRISSKSLGNILIHRHLVKKK